MKILNLRFQNLNSLYGEWNIDFTDPTYQSDGIFAITGPTGAGKSTILDAICLALYGRTPRLKNINKSGNEIMSRQTGECFAEVSFKTQEGQYKCHWSQHRARKKADGKLAESKHEISDLRSCKVLESKKKFVANAIEQITGLDFDRFTRSILLAQGDFASFLQANADQRAPILEQITGTEIYSDISVKVHERKNVEREKHDLLNTEINSIDILGDEELALLQKDLSGKEKEENELDLLNKKLDKNIRCQKEILSLKKELEQIHESIDDLKGEQENFKGDHERLKKALKASELQVEHASLEALRLQEKADQEDLIKIQVEIKRLAADLIIKEKEYNLANEKLAMTKQDQKNEVAMLKKVRGLDLRLHEKKISFKPILIEIDELEKKIEVNSLEKKSLLKENELGLQKLSSIESYLSNNKNDSALVADLAGFKEQFKNLSAYQKELISKNKELLAFKKKINSDEEKLAKNIAAKKVLKEKQTDATDAINQNRSETKNILDGFLLREHRTKRETLISEQAYRTKIASLEEERAKLEDGVQCPLCGSEEHPFAQGNIPEVNEMQKEIQNLTNLILQVEDLENVLKELEKNATKIDKEIAELEKTSSIFKVKSEETNHKFLVSNSEFQKIEEDVKNLTIELESSLEPFGVISFTEMNLEDILDDLVTRQKKWLKHLDDKVLLDKNINDFSSELKIKNTLIENAKSTLKEKNLQKEKYELELEILKNERHKLYDEKNPDIEEERLTHLVNTCEDEEAALKERRDLIIKNHNEFKTRKSTLLEGVASRKPEWEKLEKNFLSLCLKQGFENEAIYSSNLLNFEEREALNQKAKILDEKKSSLGIRKIDIEKRLNKEMKNISSEVSLENLEIEEKVNAKELKLIGETIGAIKQKLKFNEEAKSKASNKLNLLEAQRKECAKWEALHSLIGSSDGKKFRNYAQGLTFELMITHANKQLMKMSDRYLLLREATLPLDLNVIDNYQGGEIRSTKNLSGGEGFIISLALALGLSKMASRKVRIDSLFLDEGFGTLDEEALETALETLSSLQEDGKLIGIISHISALKERIPAQIKIESLTGGKSKIHGPGCENR